METPVLLFLSSEPEQVEAAMRAIAAARPLRLFLVADAPDPADPTAAERARLARWTAERMIDWPCEVSTDYADTRQGPGLRPVTGLSWVFEQVEEAIILHEGVVPQVSFFRYCAALLERYAADLRVMHISGTARSPAPEPGAGSYRFSQLVDTVGWATWRRAWRHYDFSARSWPTLRRSGELDSILAHNEPAIRHYSRLFQRIYEHPSNPPPFDFWQPQWTLACWANSGLAIVPSTSLVEEVPDETFASGPASPALPLSFPLIHPAVMLPDSLADQRQLAQLQFADPAAPAVARRSRRQRPTPALPGPL